MCEEKRGVRRVGEMGRWRESKNSTAFFAAISASKASIAAVLALAVKVKASAERLPIVYRWGIGRNSRERVGWTPAVAKMAGCGKNNEKNRIHF